ncbi:hypothetical protein BDI4_580032 [Burkholderia diffusa]|nr:hypothetical protein BDI4_580032 [Burkholderia diffusa]
MTDFHISIMSECAVRFDESLDYRV